MIDENPDKMLLQRKGFGWGLKCAEVAPGVDIGRDVVLNRGLSGVDLERVEGMANLAQALTMAFTTGLGMDVFNVRFGFDGIRVLAEESNPIMARERIRVSAIQILQKDPRIRRILEVTLHEGETEAERVSQRMLRELHLAMSFETITFEQVSLNLGKVIPYV